MSLSTEEIQKKVEGIALPLLGAAGVDLVELKVKQHHKDVNIEFTADLPEGGITIGQCAQLNRAIVEALDLDGFLGEDYTLEFSSPGLDRPLTTSKDFARNLNYEIRLLLNTAVEGKKELTGVLVSVNPDSLTMLVKKKKQVIVLLGQIIEGMLVI
jgi:ribosome maturation factor RimP